jgi:hypothetical protein
MGSTALADSKRFTITTNWGTIRVHQCDERPRVVANAGFAAGFQYGGIGIRASVTEPRLTP